MPVSDFVTPATADYLWLGMAVITLIMGVLVTSYFTRARSLQRDMDMLDSLEQD
jgi:hypothetical protein